MTKKSGGSQMKVGGQGHGHLKNPGAFSGAPGHKVTKHAPVGHPKRGGKHNVKGK